MLGDVTTRTDKKLEQFVRMPLEVTHVLHTICQNATGLNATEAGVLGERSGFVKQLSSLRKVFQRAFPDCKQEELCGMVASFSQVRQLWQATAYLP